MEGDRHSNGIRGGSGGGYTNGDQANRSHRSRAGHGRRGRGGRPDRQAGTSVESASVLSDATDSAWTGPDAATTLHGHVNRKGQVSLTHLLNFSLPPRQPSALSQAPRRRRRPGAGSAPFNKERFINANFRFVTRPSGDYTVQASDPDVPVEWEDIEQVVIVAKEDITCPICLSKPVAPRMTRCGHVFCYGCILRYLDTDPTEDDPRRRGQEEYVATKRNWRKCPICWDAIMRKALRGVIFVACQSADLYGAGGSRDAPRSLLRMQLVQCDPLGALALPYSSPMPDKQRELLHVASSHALVPWDAHPGALCFSKISLASRARYVMDLESELAALKSAIKDARDWQSPDEIPYLESAIAVVRDKKKAVIEHWTANMEHSFTQMQKHWQTPRKARSSDSGLPETTTTETPPPETKDAKLPQKEWRQDASDENAHPIETFKVEPTSAHPSPIPDKPADPGRPAKQTKATKPEETNPVPADDLAFYQSDDGRYIFLHPLYLRALRMEHDTIDQLPQTIEVVSNGVEESTVTEELRKRFKFLRHLPLGCDISFIDIDLAPFISNKTLTKFKVALRERSNRLKAKQRREQRDQARSDRATALQYHTSRAEQAELDAHHFPAPSQQVSPSDFDRATVDNEAVRAAWADAAAARGTAAPSAPTASTASDSRFSFASALRVSTEEAAKRQESRKINAWTAEIPEETRVTRKGKKTLVLLSNHGRRQR